MVLYTFWLDYALFVTVFHNLNLVLSLDVKSELREPIQRNLLVVESVFASFERAKLKLIFGEWNAEFLTNLGLICVKV